MLLKHCEAGSNRPFQVVDDKIKGKHMYSLYIFSGGPIYLHDVMIIVHEQCNINMCIASSDQYTLPFMETRHHGGPLLR